MGPDGAKGILDFHEATREWDAKAKQSALADMRASVDLSGNIVDVLRSTPGEGRMDTFSQLMTPYAQDPAMKEQVKTIASMFRDGDFGDEKLDSLSAMAAGFLRYQEIHDNRLKAAAAKDENAAGLASKERIAGAGLASKERIAGAGLASKERIAGAGLASKERAAAADRVAGCRRSERKSAPRIRRGQRSSRRLRSTRGSSAAGRRIGRCSFAATTS